MTLTSDSLTKCVLSIVLIACQIGFTQQALSEEVYEEVYEQESTPSPSNKNTTVRKFHEVLTELLDEFGHDVKSNQVQGLKNIAIRKVRVSEALPKSYENYLDVLTSEKIRKNSDIRLINCIPCRAKTSTIADGQLKISSPETNLDQLKIAANQMGIENFMDIVLVYHTTHMVLAYQIFDVKTGEMVWAKAYNSETIRSRFQKLAIDYNQVVKSRDSDVYEPEYRYLLGVGGGGIANISGDDKDNTALSINFRATEKFNNRTSEFGMMFSYYSTLAAITTEYPSTGGTGTDAGDDSTVTVTNAQPLPFESAAALYAVYAHNFLGPIETYDTLRHGLNIGLGGIVAKGYIAGIIRAGWDLYMGRRFATTLAGSYILPSEIIVEDDLIDTDGGAAMEVVFSFNF